MKSADYKLEEQGIIRTRKMRLKCRKCEQYLHWGEYLVTISDEENSMIRILCRDIFCNCGERYIAIPVIFSTLERAKQEREFCETRSANESLDWYKFWKLAPLLWE